MTSDEPEYREAMTARRLLLKVHLYLGLTAALFLVILGLTGSVMAFENDIPRWLNSDLFYVKVGPRALPEQELIRIAELRFAPARVRFVQFLRQPNLARAMQLSGGVTITMNPYDGTVLGSWKGPLAGERMLGFIHQIHLRLAPDPRSIPKWSLIGKQLISWAGAILGLLVPTGAILFWRTKRSTIEWRASWTRICFDAHHVVGIYSAVFLLIAAATGILIGFDWGNSAIYSITHSDPPPRQRPSESAVIPGATPMTVDRAIDTALGVLRGTTVAGVIMPAGPKGAYTVLLRVPEETSEAVHGNVVLDQYDGRVLQVHDFLTESRGYRVIRFNRSIHTGDVFGTPTHVIVSVSSLLLVVMVVTGLVIWWRKLAV
jgi:uncharacterized iron-regulated membrane protein